MDRNRYYNKIKSCILANNEIELCELLNSGLDPNFEGGWPIRLSARHGFHSLVKVLLQYGANPHLLSESGASTLQLAVYSCQHWNSDKWTLLLSCCDSSQLADGAAVAIIFQNFAALKKILETGRCNTNIATTLTGKTLKDLAKGYKLQHLLTNTIIHNHPRFVTPTSSPRTQSITLASANGNDQLSPSVAQFFHQTANQTSLTPPRNNLVCSPVAERLLYRE